MINDVYNLVQSILNKNRFGEITPTRFNLYAKNAQIKIFNNALDSLRRSRNRKHSGRGDEDLQAMEQVLDSFADSAYLTRSPSATLLNHFPVPENFAHEISLWYKDTTIIQEADKELIGHMRGSYIVPASLSSPYYIKMSDKIHIFPQEIGALGGEPIDTDVLMYYYRNPSDPVWTYTEVSGKAIFDSTSSSYNDFELPRYMLDAIVVDILLHAGIQLREADVARIAQEEDNQEFTKSNIS